MPQPNQPPDDILSRSISPEELPDPRTSLTLLAEAQRGNRRALEDLVERYQQRLRRIVRIQLGGSAVGRHYESMDIVQNTFRAALPKINDLQPRSAASLLQWLAIIATNQIRDANDHLRAGKRDIEREETDALVSGADKLPAPIADQRSPEEQALMNEVRELLDAEVSQLPEDQRRVVLLRDYCGEDWDRIASELSRESGATRQLHQRAWIHLRKALRPKLEGRRLSGSGGES